MAYLDYAAHAPLRPEVRARLQELAEMPLGNPSSLHEPGRRARMLLEEARERCASFLGVKVEEIVFTSGATEANNLALRGVLRPGDHLLVSAVEHPSVRDCAREMGRLGVEVETIPVDGEGRVEPAEVLRRLRAETRLVSVMAVNNEVGTIQPALDLPPGVLLHVDGVQQPGPVGRADLYTVSAHKLGGPVGSGLLVTRVELHAQIVGGAQEDNRRAGTSHCLGAVGLALALSGRPDVRALRDELERRLDGLGLVGLARGAPRADHISAWLAPIPAETALVHLDLAGVAASSGSACSSHSIEASHVLLAMGYSQEQARRLVRFSLGWNTTMKDVEAAARAMEALCA